MKRLDIRMPDHITSEELSAFIDGEARNASKIRLHIEHCDECTARIEAHKALRDKLNLLQAPDVHPAFATRVRATIEEQDFEPAPMPWHRWVYSISGVAVLALLTISLLSNNTVPLSTDAPENEISVAEAQWKSILEQDEAEVAQKLEISLAREWVDSAISLAPYEVAAPDSADTETAVLSIVLSRAEPQALRADLLVKDSDAMTEISRMSPAQSDLFKQMLVMHAREEILGDNAHEV